MMVACKKVNDSHGMQILLHKANERQSHQRIQSCEVLFWTRLRLIENHLRTEYERSRNANDHSVDKTEKSVPQV